jgi:hypothetical protein
VRPTQNQMKPPEGILLLAKKGFRFSFLCICMYPYIGEKASIPHYTLPIASPQFESFIS